MSNNQDLYPAEVLNIPAFVLAGKASFTIENLRSGRSYKYKVYASDDNDRPGNKIERFFVRVHDGENEQYAGCLVVYPHGGIYYKQGKKGAYEENSPAIRGLMMALNTYEGGMHRPMVLYHHGICARCGRKLTDPKSANRGIGPECFKKI